VLFKGYSRRRLGRKQVAGEASIDLAPIKTEPSESLYRIFTSMHTDGHGVFNKLNIVTKLNPHESNSDLARSVFLRLLGWSLEWGLRDTRDTVRARVHHLPRVTCTSIALPSNGPSSSISHQLPVCLDTAISTAECRSRLSLRRCGHARVADP